MPGNYPDLKPRCKSQALILIGTSIVIIAVREK